MESVVRLLMLTLANELRKGPQALSSRGKVATSVNRGRKADISQIKEEKTFSSLRTLPRKN